jgi:hypothetical protein
MGCSAAGGGCLVGGRVGDGRFEILNFKFERETGVPHKGCCRLRVKDICIDEGHIIVRYKAPDSASVLNRNSSLGE